MPTTYSPALRLALPATGEDAGTWGTIVNSNITAMIEQAITGSAAVVMPADADYTLTTASGTTDQARCIVLYVTSSVSLTANRNIIVPTGATKPYLAYNNTTGGQTITVKTSGGTGVPLANGAYALVGSADGTNYVFFTPVTTSGAAATANALNTSNAYTVNGLTNNSTTVFGGTMTNSAQPAFEAYSSVTQTSGSTLIFGFIHNQRGGTNYNVATGVFTVPTTGMYYVATTATINNSSGGTLSGQLHLYMGATDASHIQSATASIANGSFATLSFNGLIYATAGQTMQVQPNTTLSATFNVSGGSLFSAALIC